MPLYIRQAHHCLPPKHATHQSCSENRIAAFAPRRASIHVYALALIAIGADLAVRGWSRVPDDGSVPPQLPSAPRQDFRPFVSISARCPGRLELAAEIKSKRRRSANPTYRNPKPYGFEWTGNMLLQRR